MVDSHIRFESIIDNDPIWKSLEEFGFNKNSNLNDYFLLDQTDQLAVKQILTTSLEVGRTRIASPIGSIFASRNSDKLFIKKNYLTYNVWDQSVVIGHSKMEWHYNLTRLGWTLKSHLDPSQILGHNEILSFLGFHSQEESLSDHFGMALQMEAYKQDGNYVQIDIKQDAITQIESLSGSTISLPNATNEQWKMSWSDIVGSRNSLIQENGLISIQDIGSLLDLTMRCSENGKRNYPSAGAFYPLHIFLAWNGTLYLYHPLKHELIEVSKLTSHKECIIYIAGNLELLTKKYELIPERLMLLNTGVIYQQLALGVAATGLQGHALGCGGDKLIERMIRTRLPSITDVYGQYQLAGRIK